MVFNCKHILIWWNCLRLIELRRKLVIKRTNWFGLSRFDKQMMRSLHKFWNCWNIMASWIQMWDYQNILPELQLTHIQVFNHSNTKDRFIFLQNKQYFKQESVWLSVWSINWMSINKGSSSLSRGARAMQGHGK